MKVCVSGPGYIHHDNALMLLTAYGELKKIDASRIKAPTPIPIIADDRRVISPDGEKNGQLYIMGIVAASDDISTRNHPDY
jgi:hypothetical protein